MATPKRMSLADRRRQAIEQLDEPQETNTPATVPATLNEPTAEQHQAEQLPPAAAQAAAAPGTSPRRKTVSVKETTTAPPVGTTRAGIYFDAEDFEAAKAAYLADWQNGGEEDTFTRWIAAAIATHAKRTPKERLQLANASDRVIVNGVQRTFNLPNDVIRQMRNAISRDASVERWPSDSAWCEEAVAAAVDAARERNGGTLPKPPARLPNRLKR